MFKRALARLPVVVPIWFLAIIFPFFGPINSTVGSLLVSFTVYIIPALAHMITFAPASARENAVERPPSFLGGWAGSYSVNIFVVGEVMVSNLDRMFELSTVPLNPKKDEWEREKKERKVTIQSRAVRVLGVSVKLQDP
ncbi:hypothetical protein L1049_027007 [Liquidambar formosana]|uniref:Amino acid transporter transmembrane domain-containing protein n=1 Tax=Liquidambar formosana TaxID=63359 RepID=A0AAP0NFY0_LIQFO